MFKLQTFKHTDNKWYVGVFNSNGDFVKNLGSFSSLEEANNKLGVNELTPAGEVIEVESELTFEEIDLSSEENNKVESEVGIGTPNIPTEEEVVEDEVVDEKLPETLEVSEDGKTATFEDGTTAPVVSREELVNDLGEEEVKRLEDEIGDTIVGGTVNNNQ